MKPSRQIQEMLSGGHPNSLGRTIEVVDSVLKNETRLIDVYSCYFSSDEVIRLRVSNAMKRVCRDKPEWLVPFVDGLITEISKIKQASTHWTLASLFQMLWDLMNGEQQDQAKKILKRNLESWDDWIVLNTTAEALAEMSVNDPKLKKWLLPRLDRLTNDKRRSVAGKAKKLQAKLLG